MKSFSKDVVIYGGADFLSKGVGFLAVAIYTHSITVAQFGIMALLTVSATLLASIVNMGVNNAVQRFYFVQGATEAEQRTLVSTGLLQLVSTGIMFPALAGAVLWALRTTIESEYGIQWLWMALLLANILPEQVAQYAQDAVRLHFAPWRFAAISVTRNALGILLGIYLLSAWDLGLTGVFIGTLAGSSIGALLGLWLIRHDLSLVYAAGSARAIFRFGYPFVLAGGAYWVFGSMDRWLLIQLSSAEQVGLFSLAAKLASILSLVIAAFAQAWGPHILRLARDDPGYRGMLGELFPVLFFALAFLGLIVALFSGELLMLLTPAAYWPAAPILPVALAGIVLFGTTQITALGISLEKRTMLLSSGAWIAAAVNVVANLLLIPPLGAMGSALATVLAYAALTGSFLRWSQQLHPIPLAWGKLAYCVLVVGACILAPAALQALSLSPATALVKVAVLLAILVGAYRIGLVRAPRTSGLVPAQAQKS